jgi:putative component of toxin-antitoxin plasmid stabilization module
VNRRADGGLLAQRVMFGKQQQRILLLLLGGTKASQPQNIRRAQQYWSDYLEAHHGTA